jgi:hypothetical protein
MLYWYVGAQYVTDIVRRMRSVESPATNNKEG